MSLTNCKFVFQSQILANKRIETEPYYLFQQTVKLNLLSFSASARKTVFFASERASFAAPFPIDFFVRIKKVGMQKNLQQPLEAFHLKFSFSSMARRTFSSGINRQAKTQVILASHSLSYLPQTPHSTSLPPLVAAMEASANMFSR